MKVMQGICILMIIGIITSCASNSTFIAQNSKEDTGKTEEEQIVIEPGWYHYPFKFPGVEIDSIFIRQPLVRKLPVYYPDAAVMMAGFPVPIGNVKELIAVDKLVPVEIEPDFTCIILTALEFREVDRMSGYNEVPISIPVTYEGREETRGAYPVYKPITSLRGLWAGVIYWRAPKVMAEISFVDTDDTRKCIVKIGGKDLITVIFKKVPPNQMDRDMYWYSIKNAKILRNLLAMKGQIGVSKQRNGASFTLGKHPIAQQLKILETGESSLFHGYAPKVKIVLHKAGKGGIFPLEK